MRGAAIDIGSNSLLLCIVELNRPLKILLDEAHVTGLAKRLSSTGDISPESAERSFSILRQFRSLMSQYQVTKIQVAATEALRRARNGQQIKEQIEKILKVPVNLISGDREASLSFWSVQNEHPALHRRKIVFDIGGASTEVCLGASHGIDNRTSLKVGSVVLTEKFRLDQQNINPQPAKDYVRSLIESHSWMNHAAQIPSLGIGVAGTITSLFAMEQRLNTYERTKVHGQTMKQERIFEWLKRFLQLSPDERREIRGLEPARADVFGGGLVILSALMEYFRWEELHCMDSGVRFGLLYEMLQET